ncbi:MAG TPA: EAL domain-containing protein [Burkholderiales bacterium]|nr:EAL domain-containing protein [Burkholderiales bacterium]
MPDQVRILHLEDNALDAELIQRALRDVLPACEIRWAARRRDYEQAVANERFDLILADHEIPDYTGIDALGAARLHQPETPIIVITGTLSDEEAVRCIKAGATDYLLKDRLQRLAPAVERALRERRELRQRREAETALRLSEERLQLALEASEVGVWEVNVMSGDIAISRQLGPMLGYAAEEVPSRIGGWEALIHPSDVKKVRVQLARHHRGESSAIDIEYQVRAKDGQWRWLHTSGRAVSRDAAGRAIRMLGTHRDVTELKRYQTELEFRVNYDTLTGLANKNLLGDRLDQAIALGQRARRGFGLLCLDLDRFKLVNDSLGHAAGDELLKIIAARLKQVVRDADTVARLGGDEFAVILHELDQPTSATVIAQKILAAAEEPISVGGQEVFTSASIGVALFPQDGNNSDELLKNADVAMYRAKGAGRNQMYFYTQDLNTNALQRLRLEAALRHAIAQEEFELHYQPRVELRTGRITSVEALVRWRGPDGSLVPPGHFIPLAEETGLIVPIGEWVLHAACSQMRIWRDAGRGDMRVAVNLSARQFRQPDLVQRVGAVLQTTGLDSRNLEFEITESAAMHDAAGAAEVLEQLHALGVAQAIDDFGTGYSSLAYLKRFPIDYLKIDQSFVRGLPEDEDDQHIVRAIIALGRSLGLILIAEGVETEAQRAFLNAHDCDEMQGYLYCRPKPEHEITGLLLANLDLAPRG